MAALKVALSLFFLTLFLAPSLPAMKLSSRELLWGKWDFFGFYYKGKEMAPLNPKLHIRFEFKPPKSVWLKYWREDETGFCERLALFELLQNEPSHPKNYQLYQKVVWVNPENQGACAQDPDMQFETQSWSPIEVDETELDLVLPLGNDKLTYRFKRKSPDKKTKGE